MKKVAVLGLASLFLLTGCGSKKVTCSRDFSAAGIKVTSKVTASFKGKKINGIELAFETNSKDTAKLFCTQYKDAKCSGKTATIKGDAAYSMMGISKSDVKDVTKSDFVDAAKANGFKCN
ncbi:MAG: hypothetical protein K6G37_02040 [Bacilli bacterium]|nr:hypothetical protein [Bacilli bacterium]